MKHIIPVLALALSIAGCKTTKTKTITPTEAQKVTQTEQVFCEKMIQQCLAEEENVFLSPASAAMALSMLTPGAVGQTQQELLTIVPEGPSSVLPHREEAGALQIASAMWINEGFKVLPSFLRANRQADIYAGKITAEKVNNWASDHTNGKITQILRDPLPRYEMILTNAIHFKAEWAAPFNSRNTRTEPFFGSAATSEVEMMHQTEHLPYMENDLYQAVRLYYTSTYCMDIYLPRESVSGGIAGWEPEQLEAVNREDWETKKVSLSLPKVKLEYEKKLNDILQNMGLRTCFTQQADFSRLSKTPVYVDFVKQNTFLSIDEEGTEAAAVTTIGLAKMAYRPEPEQIYEMRVNRPFLLLIRETESNRILFFGLIKNL